MRSGIWRKGSGQPAAIEKFDEKRGRGRAVDVIIAEDGDLLAGLDRPRQALDRGVHVLQQQRVRHQRAQGRIEKGGGRLLRHPPPRQDARESVAMAVNLRDGGRLGLLMRPQAGAPGAARDRALDAEEERSVAPGDFVQHPGPGGEKQNRCRKHHGAGRGRSMRWRRVSTVLTFFTVRRRRSASAAPSPARVALATIGA